MDGLINRQDVATGVLTNLCEDTIKFAWNKVSKYFKDLINKSSIDLGYAYGNYLNQTKIRYGKIKTLINNKIPKDLYSLYECVGIKYGDRVIDTSLIQNVIDLGNKIIITGTGGVGKTTMLKHFFLNTIETTEYIPVLIELRAFNTNDNNMTLYEMIHKALCDNSFSIENEYFEYSLKEGGYIILLDGYDELNQNMSKKVLEEVKSLSNKYNKNHYIISSRPSEEFIGWNDFIEMPTLPLSKEQAINMIKK